MMIVGRNVEDNSYKNRGMTCCKDVEVVRDTIIPFTGGLEQLDPFIVPLIRWQLDDKCPGNEYIVRRCMLHTFADIRVHII